MFIRSPGYGVLLEQPQQTGTLLLANNFMLHVRVEDGRGPHRSSDPCLQRLSGGPCAWTVEDALDWPGLPGGLEGRLWLLGLEVGAFQKGNQSFSGE